MSSMDALSTDPSFHNPPAFGIEAEQALFIKESESSGKKVLTQYGSNEDIRALCALFREFDSDLFARTYGSDHVVYPDVATLEIVSFEHSSPSNLAIRFINFRERVVERLGESGLILTLTNADHTNTSSFHENYFTTIDHRNRSFVGREMAAFLISRIIFLGSGGIGGDGHFVLSPRSTYMNSVVSSDSTAYRGLSLIRSDDNVGANIGMRFMAMNACNVDDSETLALLVGTTSLALRLLELDLLPPTFSSGEWFKELDKINHIFNQDNRESYLCALEYQKAVYKVARGYIQFLEDNRLPAFFGSREEDKYILNAWGLRLRSLDRYYDSGNIEDLTSWSSWANKYSHLISTKDEKLRQQNCGMLSEDDIYDLFRLAVIQPWARSPQLKDFLNESPIEVRQDITTPRGEFRKQIINFLKQQSEKRRIRINYFEDSWNKMTIEMLDRPKIIINLPTHLHGSSADIKTVKKTINQAYFARQEEIVINCELHELSIPMRNRFLLDPNQIGTNEPPAISVEIPFL